MVILMIMILLQVDVAVVEVGMGGAYDSTNHIPYVEGGKEGGRNRGRRKMRGLRVLDSVIFLVIYHMNTSQFSMSLMVSANIPLLPKLHALHVLK